MVNSIARLHLVGISTEKVRLVWPICVHVDLCVWVPYSTLVWCIPTETFLLCHSWFL